MTPREIANQQLIAYNNHDIDAYCALFHDDATLIDLPSSKVVAEGIKQIKSMYQARFAIPELTCKVHSTSDIADFAIDRETVYGLPDGPVDIAAMYEVIDSKIKRLFFIRE
ncbi:hypothetical protein EYS14_16645 [Alteromonadaceae bacterium M269]|nr:hypothetical protein EYS14_16645 [Alteromonadaceae bacterium M269]